MNRSKAYVITAMQSWDAAAPGNAQRMASLLARMVPVLYVNPPLDLLTLLGAPNEGNYSRKNRVLRGSESAIRHIASNLWVLEPPLILTPPMNLYSEWVFDLFNRHNNRRYAGVISWALDTIGLELAYLIVDNDIFRSLYLDDYLVPDLTIYYRRGNFPGFDYWRKHGVRLEREMMERCDLVAASSEYLATQVRRMNENTYNIGRGVDLTGFEFGRAYSRPREMRGIRPPVIGCVGLLGAMNYSANLLYRLAHTYPDCSLVLIGGEDAAFARHALHELENVFFLGEKPSRNLPAYISHFDVCITPETRNELTEANYPDSVVHYLALGKNVVSTATEAMEEFRGYVSLAEDEAHFLGLVGIALYESVSLDVARRRAEFAKNFTWEACVDRLHTLIEMSEDPFYRPDESLVLQRELLS